MLTFAKRISIPPPNLAARTIVLTMSLRRSSRLASSTAAAPTATNDANARPEAAAHYTKPKAPTASKKRKSSPSPPPPTSIATPHLPPPSTPKRRKPLSSVSPEKPIPFTPTPAAIALLSKTSTLTAPPPHPLEAPPSPAANPRPANPQATNAPLATPGGGNVVAYASAPLQPSLAEPSPANPPEGEGEKAEVASPSKRKKAAAVVPPDMGALQAPTSNTDTLLRDACEFLCSVDPGLKGLVEKHHCMSKAFFFREGMQGCGCCCVSCYGINCYGISGNGLLGLGTDVCVCV